MERVMQRNSWPPPVHHDEPAPLKPNESPFKALRVQFSKFYARYQSLFLLAAIVIVAVASIFVYSVIKIPPQRLTQRDIDDAVARSLATATPKPSYESEVYDIIRPSVVRVEVTAETTEGESKGAVGTGVIIDDTGTILTSLHVVRGATKVSVIFADGSESEATITMAQEENDLAVLRPLVIPDDLVPATLTSSDTLHVGDDVVAVGNPFGIDDSLSAGVVSGLGRSFQSPATGQTLSNLIQFDAAVNPGNSGGPLVNRDGEVVGIVTALLNPTDQDVFIGIGFAVPIETAASAAGAPPV
jgi:S1-C subfamily serine protease